MASSRSRKWILPSDGLHKEVTMGPLCPFSAHSIGSRDGNIPRYSDSQACVRCIAALTEGRVSLDVHRIHRSWRRRFLEFWTFVEIGDPKECWEWHGATVRGNPNATRHAMKRHWITGTSTPSFSAPRIAAWLSWGDFGRLPIEHTCQNPSCCNPLHIRVVGVPHFHHNRKLDVIDLRFNALKLQNETLSFAQLTRARQPLRFKRLERINQGWLDYVLRDSDLSLEGPIDDEEELLAMGREHEPDPNLD